MGKAWVKRWSPSVKDGMGSLIPALVITPIASIEKVPWRLPPSKSHAIRWLALGAQSRQNITLNGMGDAGQDIVSMRRCLSQMGVSISDLDGEGRPLEVPSNHDDQPAEGSETWLIQGVGPHGLKPPVSVLHAGNSGTALRILMALCARFDVPVMVDGDASLRSRNHQMMVDSLVAMGVRVSHGTDVEGLPLLVEGPWNPPSELHLDVSTSSQPTTAWLLASPALSKALGIVDVGEGVSLRHSGLTRDLCKQTGAAPGLDEGDIEPWTPSVDAGVDIPRDASMLAFAFLAARVTGGIIEIESMPKPSDAIGHEILLDLAEPFGLSMEAGRISPKTSGELTEVDLRHANDLITPLAALLALGQGGRIVGAQHAAFKETDRTHGTVALLEQFGLSSSFVGGELVVEGEQRLQQPEGLVETFGDHRMQMTALVLAMGCTKPVLVEGAELHKVADPEGVSRWRDVGVGIEAVLHQPW